MNFKIQQSYPSPPAGLSEFNTLTYIQHLQILVLYGYQRAQAQVVAEQPKKKIGFKSDKTSQAPASDKICVYSLAQRKWSVVEAKGKIPSARSGFMAIYIKPCLIIYGGTVNGRASNQVYTLNCQTWTWKKLFSLDGPPPCNSFQFFRLSQHTAGLVSAQTLWLLQLVDVKWQLASNELPGSVWEKTQFELPGEVLGAFPLSQSKILILFSEQSLKLDLQTRQITKVSIRFSQFWNRPNTLLDIYTLGKSEGDAFYVCIIGESQVHLRQFSKSDEDFTGQRYKNSTDLQRLARCCTLVNKAEGQIFYIDTKGELVSVELSTSRKIIQIIERRNSSIVEEESNEDSMFGADTNSRIRIESKAANDGASQEQDYLVDSGLLHTGHKGQRDQRKEDSVWGNGALAKTEQIKALEKGRQESSRSNVNNEGGRGGNEKGSGRGRSKPRTEEDGEMQAGVEKEGEDPSEAIQLKYRLQNILYNESVKRKLLEAKVEALEGIIRKSQRFVLMLCRYSDQPDKHRHIGRVRSMRQELEWNWSREIYYRKEMQLNKLPSQVSHQIQQTLNHIQY